MIDASSALFYLFLLTGMILSLVLLINNFVFYRRKLKDDISLMVIFCFVTCLFELLWAATEGRSELKALIYLFAIGYLVFAFLFASFFSRFFLKFFDYFPNKKWQQILIYWVPNIVIFVLSATTPWTHLVYSMSDTGYIVEEAVFLAAEIMVTLYFIASLVVSIVYFTKNKEDKKATKKVIFMLIGFIVISPLTLVLQYVFLGTESEYINLSICYALALTFLVSNLNTYLLVESEGKMKAIETELKIASKIQEDALPIRNPDLSNKFEIALRASMDTAKDVGGDFYDYFPLDDHRLCFLIADVSGKGTPAALFMMTAKTVIKDHALIYGDTAKIFELSNNRLQEGNKATMFATSWIAIFDTETMTLQYTNAGHTYPIFYHKNSGAKYVKNVDGLILGVMKDMPYKSNTVKVEKGDRIFLYTDGVTEAHNTKDELYGEDRLMEIFTKNIDKTEDEMVDIIFKDIVEFSRGAPQFDDITMMVLTIK